MTKQLPRASSAPTRSSNQRQLRKQEQEIKRMLAANKEKKMAQIPSIPLEQKA